MTQDQIDQCVQERNAAFLSLDEERIREYMIKWNGVDLPSNPDTFWASVHKAITAVKDLPINFRRQSKKYLTDRGMHSLDDGDL